VHALDEGVGLETVSSLAARYGATAAVNGGYFRTGGTFRGDSLGVLKINGLLISEPHNERAAIGLTFDARTNALVFGHLKFAGAISTRGGRHDVAGINRAAGPDELIVFTPYFHRTTLTTPDGVEVLVRRDSVVALRDLQGSSNIPGDGFVISANGRAREWALKNLRRGSRITFSWELIPIEKEQSGRWSNIQNILSGGPQLIKQGKIAITSEEEKVAPAFVNDLHPRTALAQLNDGKVLLLTIDGRQPGVSIGISLPALAKMLLELGATEAINLDGGGSTTMVVRNKVINKPSDQTGERPVSDAILVFPRSR
jgi:hypothetical protein